MKRQRARTAEYRELLEQNDGTLDDNDDQRSIQMQNQQRQRRQRQENTLEAQIQPGDTLQAIALRYNCTISDLKRLNKIEKEIEIHARKTIKVPINAHTILLNTVNFDELPIVHKSGQSSPHHDGVPAIYTSANTTTKDIDVASTSQQQQQYHPQNNHHQLPNKILDEKLLVASVSLAANHIDRTKNGRNSIDGTRNSFRTIERHGHRLNNNHNTAHGQIDNDDDFTFTDPLIAPSLATDAASELYTTSTALDDPALQHGPHAIRGTPRSEFTCSGSDCDISWICLLIFILALCFAIPLIYIIYIAEHPEQFNHKENEQFGIVG